MRKTRSLFACVLGAIYCLGSLASAAYAAEKYYVSIEGTKQGQFKGEVQRSSKKWSEVLSFGYAVESPRDAATGQASGKRQHKPITITKEIDNASPQLFRAATTNELLKQVDIQSVQTGPKGKEQVIQTIHLTNATVSAVQKFAGKNKNEQERFQITFQKIEVTDIKGKTTATDDWTASK